MEKEKIDGLWGLSLGATETWSFQKEQIAIGWTIVA